MTAYGLRSKQVSFYLYPKVHLNALNSFEYLEDNSDFSPLDNNKGIVSHVYQPPFASVIKDGKPFRICGVKLGLTNLS